MPKIEPEEYEPFIYEPSRENTFEIEKEGNDFRIKGGLLKGLLEKVVLMIRKFSLVSKMLRVHGVMEKLYNMGLKDGDTVSILDHSFTFFE